MLLSFLVVDSVLFCFFLSCEQGVGGTEASKEVWRSTVKVERCRYLEASKCKGTCMNLCKLPTEAFFKEDLGTKRLRSSRSCYRTYKPPPIEPRRTIEGYV